MVPNRQIGFVAIYLIELRANRRTRRKLVWKYLLAARTGNKPPPAFLPFSFTRCWTDSRNDCFLATIFFPFPFSFIVICIYCASFYVSFPPILVARSSKNYNLSFFRNSCSFSFSSSNNIPKSKKKRQFS